MSAHNTTTVGLTSPSPDITTNQVTTTEWFWFQGKTTAEIIALNTYVLGMTNFSLTIVLNLATIGVILCTVLRKKSSAIYLIFLLLVDLLFIIHRTILVHFYQPWIDVDVFDLVDDPKPFCQAWVFLTETTKYWRQWLLAAVIIDRCIAVQLGDKFRVWACVLFIFIPVSLAVNAGAAAYWIKIVGDELSFSPYRRIITCQLPRTQDYDTSSAHFWMEAAVSLMYPNAVMNIVILIATICLIAITLQAEKRKPAEKEFTKAMITLAWVNALLTLPFIVVNGCLDYVDRKYDFYSSEFFQENLVYITPITEEIKYFIHWITFFVMLSVRQFRLVGCCCCGGGGGGGGGKQQQHERQQARSKKRRSRSDSDSDSDDSTVPVNLMY